eukprot:2694606-Alexandrium_andersonii.AAC.1
MAMLQGRGSASQAPPMAGPPNLLALLQVAGQQAQGRPQSSQPFMPAQAVPLPGRCGAAFPGTRDPVSYTHLTLPTICSV